MPASIGRLHPMPACLPPTTSSSSERVAGSHAAFMCRMRLKPGGLPGSAIPRASGLWCVRT